MLKKTIEFKSKYGKKVKILEVPVMNEENPLYFKVNLKLHQFVTRIVKQNQSKTAYNFREYLKKTTKWSDYEKIYQSEELKNNA